MTTEHKALLAEARHQLMEHEMLYGPVRARHWAYIAYRLADALETAERDKREAQAEALEAAAGDMEDADFRRDGAMLVFGNTSFVYVEDWIRARAVEIREGRQ